MRLRRGQGELRMTRYVEEVETATGDYVTQTTVYCDANGCDMFARVSSRAGGYIVFGGYVTVTEEVAGQAVTRDYCSWCYARSKGFMI